MSFQRSAGSGASTGACTESPPRPGNVTTLSLVAPRTASRAEYGSYGGRSRPVRWPRTVRSFTKMSTATARKMMVQMSNTSRTLSAVVTAEPRGQ